MVPIYQSDMGLSIVAEPQPEGSLGVTELTCQIADTLLSLLDPPSPTCLDPTSLDADRNNSTPSCLVGWLTQQGPLGAKQIPIFCDRWDCPRCGEKKGKEVSRRIQRSEARSWQRLLTLTFRTNEEEGSTWDQNVEKSGSCINAFWTSIRRVVPHIKYIWVREIGAESRMVHFHCLVNLYIPQSLLKRLWERTGAGSIVDIRRVSRPGAYVCKYLAKFPAYSREVSAALTGKRRYSSSRGLLSVRVSSGGWKGARFTLACLCASTSFRLLAVVDGVYIYRRTPNASV